MAWIQIISIILLFTSSQGCKDLYPKLCKEYKANKAVDTCTYKGIGKWMQANCFLSCNLCDLYTTTPPPTTTTRTPPPMVNCGKSFAQTGRVISGDNAIPGAWPWQVKLTRHGRFMCGASLVSPKWVVTAAHCVYRGGRAPDFKVILGDHKRNETDGTEVIYDVKRILIHGSYSRPYRGYNDIALIGLDRPVKMNDKIQRVCLPDEQEEVDDDTECFITGWGKTSHPGKGAEVLQQASLKTVSYEKCKKLNEGMKRKVSKSMLCAGNQISSKSGCHGDSGGPFVCKKADGRWFLQGVVSWGSPTCYSKHGYSVFTKVSHYRSWMDRFIWW